MWKSYSPAIWLNDEVRLACVNFLSTFLHYEVWKPDWWSILLKATCTCFVLFVQSSNQWSKHSFDFGLLVEQRLDLSNCFTTSQQSFHFFIMWKNGNGLMSFIEKAGCELCTEVSKKILRPSAPVLRAGVRVVQRGYFDSLTSLTKEVLQNLAQSAFSVATAAQFLRASMTFYIQAFSLKSVLSEWKAFKLKYDLNVLLARSKSVIQDMFESFLI